MTRVGIINVTGYAGAELARLLARHPEVELTSVTGRSAAGQMLPEVFPHLAEVNLPITAELDSVDLAFSALPQVASAEVVAPLYRSGVAVVDISADFRLRDVQVYRQWYEAEHPAPELLEETVYGLTELHRGALASARLVANPGCYPTGALLALAPAVREGIIEPDVVVDSKSGVSGAGRGFSLKTHFSEINENVYAYDVHGHRHLPEMEQELAVLNPTLSPRVTFMPHLIPMTRGIFTTCYATLAQSMSAEAVRRLYVNYYAGEPFARVVADVPQTKQTWANNYCLIYPTVDERRGRLVVFSCLDNLVKGAAGQAIQNMNLMLGLRESLGLENLPVYP